MPEQDKKIFETFNESLEKSEPHARTNLGLLIKYAEYFGDDAFVKHGLEGRYTGLHKPSLKGIHFPGIPSPRGEPGMYRTDQDAIEAQMRQFLEDPVMQDGMAEVLLTDPGIYSRARLVRVALKQQWTRKDFGVEVLGVGAFLGSAEGFVLTCFDAPLAVAGFFHYADYLDIRQLQGVKGNKEALLGVGNWADRLVAISEMYASFAGLKQTRILPAAENIWAGFSRRFPTTRAESVYDDTARNRYYYYDSWHRRFIKQLATQNSQ